MVQTYVAPTCRRWRKAGVNWYRTNRPAFGSQSFLLPATEKQDKQYNDYFSIIFSILDHCINFPCDKIYTTMAIYYILV